MNCVNFLNTGRGAPWHRFAVSSCFVARKNKQHTVYLWRKLHTSEILPHVLSYNWIKRTDSLHSCHVVI